MSSDDILKIAINPRTGPFFINKSSDGKITLTGGYEVGVLFMVIQGMEMSYTLHSPDDLEWGTRSDNGSWTGLIGMIQRKEADIAMGTLSITSERMEVVEYSYPYSIKDLTFATRLPVMLPKYNSFIMPFDAYTWVILLISMMILPFMFRYVIYKSTHFSRMIFIVISILLRQSISSEPKTYRNKILFSFWLISAMLISSIYSSVLLSFLTIPLREAGIQTKEQLSAALRSGSYSCATLKGSYYANKLSNSTDESSRTIGEYILRNNWFASTSKEAFKKYLDAGNTALIWSRQPLEITFQDNYLISKEVFFSSQVAFAMRKDFRYRKKLDSIIHRITASGIFLKGQNDYAYQQKLVALRSGVSNDEFVKQIELDDLFGAFFVLFTGYFLAFSVFIVEMACFYFRRKKP